MKRATEQAIAAYRKAALWHNKLAEAERAAEQDALDADRRVAEAARLADAAGRADTIARRAMHAAILEDDTIV